MFQKLKIFYPNMMILPRYNKKMGCCYGKDTDYIRTNDVFYYTYDNRGDATRWILYEGTSCGDAKLHSDHYHHYFHFNKLEKYKSLYKVYDDVSFYSKLVRNITISNDFVYKKLIFDSSTNNVLLLNDTLEPLYLIEFGYNYTTKFYLRPTISQIKKYLLDEIYDLVKANHNMSIPLLPSYQQITI